MKQLISLTLISLFFFSCSNYSNKKVYTLEIGESIEIYTSTNSCCYYCFTNKDILKHTEFLGTKRVDDGPSGCEGCNWTNAYIIKAKSLGVDTIKLKHLTGLENCDSSQVELEEYIIQVK